MAESPPPSGAAHTLYQDRLDRARREVDRLQATERSIGTYRLVVFLAGIAIAWLAIDADLLPPSTILIPIAAFVALVVRHGRVAKERARLERVASHYHHGLARIDGTWPELGVRGDRFLDPSHPYAADLDLFGRGSLFQLLCCARSATGQGTLASWLCKAASPGEIASRQRAVAELRDDSARRERLALIGEGADSEIDPEYLAEWGRKPCSPNLTTLRWIGAGLVAATWSTFVLQGLGMIPPAVFLAVLLAQAAFGSRRRNANQELVRSLELAPAELEALSHLIREIEQSEFRSDRLTELARALGTDTGSASGEIARLNRWIQLLDARRNMLFAPISIFFLWTSQITMAIEEWRALNGPKLEGWLRAVGEYETLCALSAYAFEQPRTTFPEVDEAGSPHFSATAARHPLIPGDRCVANDVSLSRECALLIVSGSNMSGKSTLMRTIGTNAVLAQMGAPVCAGHLRMSPLQIGTSMRTQDNLMEGTSRFYAEIKRLRLVVDLADGETPLLFLLDEMLAGTNSHDRGVGAEAIVRTLVERGAIGLVTTHDLKLAELADQLAPLARNVHFADQLVDGEMIFDYRMHDGPVQKSNALGLMRAIGLGV